MRIESLDALKKHPVIKALNKAQSDCDAKEHVIMHGRFTRSSIHVIQYLIIYAGLNPQQRSIVLEKLGLDISKEIMDELIDSIDWEQLLKPASDPRLKFEIKIEMKYPDCYLEAVKWNCPALRRALDTASIVTLKTSKTVTFTTKLNQRELWAENFSSDCRGWRVPYFELSEELQRKVQQMHSGSVKFYGAFHIAKGNSNIVLHIVMPRQFNAFKLNSRLMVKSGIYQSFTGLDNFYGVKNLEQIIVTMENNAQFSDVGTCASKTPISSNVYDYQARDGSTYISVRDLNVLFPGVDTVASFGEIRRKTDFDQLSIKLKTKNNTAGIYLLNQAPLPSMDLQQLYEAKENSMRASMYGFFYNLPTLISDSVDSVYNSCNIL